MTRAGIVVTIATAFLTLAGASAQQPSNPEPGSQSQPDSQATGAATFQSSSSLVVLPITVTDRQGRLVSDLTADRFSVFDSNRSTDLRYFSGEDAPVTVALVVDNSASMRKRHGEVVAAASIIARSSNPDDELLAFVFNDSVEDALGGRTLTAADESALAAALEAVRPDGRTALYDALMAALERLDSVNTTRRVLILLSDGGDNASTATLEAVLDRARRSSVTIYTIGLVDPDMQEVRGEKEVDTGVLRKLADLSGGARYLPQSAGPLLQTCQQIAHEIRHSYTIGIEPHGDDGLFHRLRVDVTAADGRKLMVRTRPGYLAPARKTR